MGLPPQPLPQPYAEALLEYNFQPILTPQLDFIKHQAHEITREQFDEIVLWKVNRWVQLTHEIQNALQISRGIASANLVLDQRGYRRPVTRDILRTLLRHRGIRLPMASTMLRFHNPEAFQIIDVRSYFWIFRQTLVLPPRKSNVGIERNIDLYIQYMDQLVDNWQQNGAGIEFRDMDRATYQLDRAARPRRERD